ncbi:hypothetical protein QUF64_14815 [Anaerolineales bacterium HSG6]|nr:hypothetical protein [Anaerolineales bacterium HSG6]MDM8530119.1 hypothetical protein [Anaerolineales bacterium HSG25]
MTERQLPIEEMVAYEEFTDRVEILRELDLWVKNIQRMASGSTALISPRRMGKTVLLDRLVNTVFFKPEYQVAPCYFQVERKEVTLRVFLLDYATTFFRQYIAYCLQDIAMYKNDKLSLEELLTVQSDHPAIKLAQESIEAFLKRYNNHDYRDAHNHWDAFIREPESLASYSGIRVALIIDEFQDMKFYIFNVAEETLFKAQQSEREEWFSTDLTAGYRRRSQSRKAPMLVSGSAVTMIFRTVMGGPLGGRFDLRYLKPFSIPDGAALLRQLRKIYFPDDSPISSENALYASAQVGGHPYYLYCLVMSHKRNRNFASQTQIDRLVEYEIQEGRIYGFWQTHFEDNRKYINDDDDEELGKKIIYYFTKYNNQPVDIKAIAKTLQAPKKKVEQKIEKLYSADLVYRTRARFYAFNDICLMRFIKFVYEQDLEGLEEIDLSQQSQFNNLKGRFLEIVVQVTMMKFNHEQLDGALFGQSVSGDAEPNTVELPLFRVVDTKQVKGSTTRSYQIDMCGQTSSQRLFWLCECKYTKAKMRLSQVKKLEAAREALRQEREEAEIPVPEIQLWLVSTGGFTDEVLNYVQGREDIYFTDHDGINQIFRAYGGNYNIPLFEGQKKANSSVTLGEQDD